jgi:hypothetical protein
MREMLADARPGIVNIDEPPPAAGSRVDYPAAPAARDAPGDDR